MRLPIRRRAILLAAGAFALPAVIVAAAAQSKANTAANDPLIAGFKETYPAFPTPSSS